MNRPQHFFQSSEQFDARCHASQRPMRESGIFGFWESTNDNACPIGPVAEPKPAQKPRNHVPLRYIISVNALFSLICTLFLLDLNVWAAPPQNAETNAPSTQKRFATSEEATKALVAAADAGDHAAMRELFGPEVTNLLTGDPVLDKTHFKKFSAAVAEKCEPERDGDNKVILNIGTNNWPFPIPLIKDNGQWFFDTDAGEEEIINRHIGRDELHAIGVCRAYVEAQKKYFNLDPAGTGVHQYAQKFKSSPGKKDGLYWETEAGAEKSPFGPLVEEAHAEGYGHKKPGAGKQPFHGYYFKILTHQGPDAPGGKESYLAHGKLAGGFAMVAYPAYWNQSGIMAFIVNQDGQVYQRNLGPKTASIASGLTQYDPDSNWTVIQDQGISEN